MNSWWRDSLYFHCVRWWISPKVSREFIGNGSTHLTFGTLWILWLIWWFCSKFRKHQFVDQTDWSFRVVSVQSCEIIKNCRQILNGLMVRSSFRETYGTKSVKKKGNTGQYKSSKTKTEDSSSSFEHASMNSRHGKQRTNLFKGARPQSEDGSSGVPLADQTAL
jgi:hypothetical protein